MSQPRLNEDLPLLRIEIIGRAMDRRRLVLALESLSRSVELAVRAGDIAAAEARIVATHGALGPGTLEAIAPEARRGFRSLAIGESFTDADTPVLAMDADLVAAPDLVSALVRRMREEAAEVVVPRRSPFGSVRDVGCALFASGARATGDRLQSIGSHAVVRHAGVVFGADDVRPSPTGDRATTDATSRSTLTTLLERLGIMPPALDASDSAERSPFLTVITRTQGRRPGMLRETLLSLTAQSCTDYEHIIVLHRVPDEGVDAVMRAVEELPSWQRAITRTIRLPVGGRAAPLNAALDTARGDYFAVLDDDDVVTERWVEAFQELATSARGQVLRTVCVDQPIAPASDGDFHVVGELVRAYPATYDVLAHLERNRTPFMCLAFPRALHATFGMRFDEILSTCEDWDFEMRSVLLVGVRASPEVTAVYRRWQGGESSESVHEPEVWDTDHARIVDALSSMTHVLPPGVIARYREVASEAHALREVNAHLEAQNAALERELAERRAQRIGDAVFRARKAAARWRRRVLSSLGKGPRR